MLRPIYGAYDIPGALLARGGVPIYERSLLIRTAELGRRRLPRWLAGPRC